MSEIENLIVRFGRLNDATTLAEFNKAMASESEGYELDYQTVLSGIKNLMLQTELGFYLVAEVQGSIIGSLMITYEWTDWRDGVFWWIQSVYIVPEFRNKGVYKVMYKKVKEMAQDISNVKGFRLYVDKDNKTAIEVYKKLGMIETNYLFYEEKI